MALACEPQASRPRLWTVTVLLRTAIRSKTMKSYQAKPVSMSKRARYFIALRHNSSASAYSLVSFNSSAVAHKADHSHSATSKAIRPSRERDICAFGTDIPSCARSISSEQRFRSCTTLTIGYRSVSGKNLLSYCHSACICPSTTRTPENHFVDPPLRTLPDLEPTSQIAALPFPASALQSLFTPLACAAGVPHQFASCLSRSIDAAFPAALARSRAADSRCRC